MVILIAHSVPKYVSFGADHQKFQYCGIACSPCDSMAFLFRLVTPISRLLRQTVYTYYFGTKATEKRDCLFYRILTK